MRITQRLTPGYNRTSMRILLVGALLLAVAAARAEDFTMNEAAECSRLRTPKACSASKQDLAEAARAFAHGLAFKKENKLPEALDAFQHASNLVPHDAEYLTAREIVRQQLVMAHVRLANGLLNQGKNIAAVAELREALQLDPTNQFAAARLNDALAESPSYAATALRAVDRSDELKLVPSPMTHGFSFRGDGRQLIQEIATAYGVKAVLDESFQSKRVRFDLDEVPFVTAMRAACMMLHCFWAPLSSTQMIVAADTTQAHAAFDRMVMRTFYLPDTAGPQELTDIVNALRTLFEIRYVNPSPNSASVTVRASAPIMDAATRFVAELDAARPQVIFDVNLYEVNSSMMHNFGINLPLQFQVFQVGAALEALASQPNVQNLINQLISSGGINQANSQSLSALLSQLQNQQNSLLQNPVATFGGGKTLMGVPIPPTTVNLSLNESRAISLESLTLRAAQGQAATMKIGDRYPILNATFAPVYNSSAISQVLANQSFIAPFPSFSYEDIGVSFKATPQIRRDYVTVAIEMEIRAIAGQSINGVPVLSNRQYSATISLQDGESGVVIGTMDRSEQRSLSGIPGLAPLPVAGTATSDENKQVTEDELLMVITPHIVRPPPATNETVITLPAGVK